MEESPLWKFFNIASNVDDLLSLSVGEPDFETPWFIRSEAIYAIEKSKTFYTETRGLKDLRQEICNYYSRKFNIHYQIDNALVTVGGSEAIDLACRILINPGDEVIICEPAYIAYRPIIELAGGVCKVIELKEENKFKLLNEDLQAAISPKTKMLLINFPSNPTGGIMTFEDYLPLVDTIYDNELIVVSDEIYAEIIYGQEFLSLANFDKIKDQIIIISGFSKAFSMTGFRLGYVLADSTIIKMMNNIHQYTIIAPHTPSQFAAIKAISKGDYEVNKMRESFERRRNFLVNNLNRIGLNCYQPDGAFYVFCNIKSTNLSSYDFCLKLVKEAKVVVIPGIAFGEKGEGFIRISYAYSIEEIKEALIRIEKFMIQFK